MVQGMLGQVVGEIKQIKLDNFMVHYIHRGTMAVLVDMADIMVNYCFTKVLDKSNRATLNWLG